MATRRKTTTRKRRTTAKTPVRRRTTTTARKPVRRRRTTKKKSMLSEMFNPKMAQAGGKALFSGAVGGMGAGFIEKIMINQTPNQKLLATAGAGFVVATVLKMPNVGAGMAGVAIYKAMESSGMLAEDDMNLQQYGYADPIEALPMVLNEDQNGMYLQEDDMFLQEGYNYGVGYPSSSEYWS